MTSQEVKKLKELAINIVIIQKGFKGISIQDRILLAQEVLREEISTSRLAVDLKVHQQCLATRLSKVKNENGKRTQETVKKDQIIGKKERNINKKKCKVEKLREV